MSLSNTDFANILESAPATCLDLCLNYAKNNRTSMKP